jgi:alpha-N-arabinofuranosidase
MTRVGDDYYLVTSTFAYFPGIPVMRSRDLVSWTQIGNVIDRPSQLSFDSLGMSRGVFAPTIQHKDGTFYVLNTCVDCGGNFVVTAKDPAGPWSEPTWLRGIGGIDPSLFFDDDGRTYILNNDAPEGTPLYEGHRAIWMQEFDLANLRPFGPRKVVINGGVDLSTKPIWIEGPHVFRHEGKYYLSAAEGGTAEGHSQVILRADAPMGPYTPGPRNPILTQRDLDRGRPNPITSAGHAELVKTQNGDWWASFLAVRPYQGDLYNTGRETFLMPVRWVDGWPVITEPGQAIPYVARRPALRAQPAPRVPTSGNFRVREEFDGPRLAPHWLMIRTPRQPFAELAAGALTLRARPVALSSSGQPAYVGRRQQHQHASASTAMRYAPARPGDKAGLAAFQRENFHYLLAVALADGKPVVRLEKHAGPNSGPDGQLVAEAPLTGAPGAPVYLKIDARGATYDFSYATRPGQWISLAKDADGTILSTKTAGGFVGVTFGLFAYAAP